MCPEGRDTGFPGGSDGKESACNARDPGSIPELGIFPGEWNGYPTHSSILAWRTVMGRRAWRATAHMQKVGHNWNDLASMHPLSDVQAGLLRQQNQISNCQHTLDHQKKKKEFKKNIYFCFIDYAKTFDCVDHNKLWKILQELEIPDHNMTPEKSVCRSRSNS